MVTRAVAVAAAGHEVEALPEALPEVEALPEAGATDRSVCRQGGCAEPGTVENLCVRHRAVQVALRARAAERPERDEHDHGAISSAFTPDGLRPSWHRQAACRGKPDLFFPTYELHAGKGHRPDYLAALAICETCPVKEPCGEAGRTERYGVWGGATPTGRRRARRSEAG